MPEYPNNSHSAKENTPPEKKLEKVVTGQAKTRKKSKARKIAGIFIPEDVANIKSYIYDDVVKPGIRQAIADIVSILLFGESGRLGGKRGNSRISYNKLYPDPRDNRRDYAKPRSMGGFEYDDIVFETRGDAELALEQMEMAIEAYGNVSVRDLYDLAGVTCQQGYTANNYGWTNLRGARVMRISDGFILQLPQTIQIS